MNKSLDGNFLALRKCVRGTISVEAALVLPLILVLAIGTIEFGWVLAQLQSVQSATRVAALTASRSEIVSDGTGNFGISESTNSTIEAALVPIFASSQIGSWSTTVDVNATSNSNGNLNGGENLFTVKVTSNFVPVSIGLLLIIGIQLPSISVNYEVRYVGG